MSTGDLIATVFEREAEIHRLVNRLNYVLGSNCEEFFYIWVSHDTDEQSVNAFNEIVDIINEFKFDKGIILKILNRLTFTGEYENKKPFPDIDLTKYFFKFYQNKKAPRITIQEFKGVRDHFLNNSYGDYQ
eukprot:gene8460-285_t